MINQMKQLINKAIKKFKKSPLRSKQLLAIFLILVAFTRFYNLGGTARFTRDESSDLARMHQYWQNKQISLVGPISSEGDKVFSSLSYYLIMPFAVAFNFTPVSPVYGMAFLGVITAILLLFLVRSVNRKYLLLAGTLIIVWFPLLTISRWAWNPHFVVFWVVLALLAYQYRKSIGLISYLVIGVSLGLMFHHHYVSIFSTAPFLILLSLSYLRKKQWKEPLLMLAGYLLPFSIFILFDLKNPPGLFFGRYLLGGNTPHVESVLSLSLIGENLYRNISVYFETLVQNNDLQILLGFSLFGLIIKELKNNYRKTIFWLTPAFSVIIGGLFLTDFYVRYVYSSIPFLLVWLLLPKKSNISRILVKLIIILLTFGSALTIKHQLTVADVLPSMNIVEKSTQIIIDTIQQENLNNANVAALASPEDAPLAEKYRDYIRMRGVGLREPSEYDVSEHLFVISTGTDNLLRSDQSYAMIAFKDKQLKQVFDLDSEWKVFWYGTE